MVTLNRVVTTVMMGVVIGIIVSLLLLPILLHSSKGQDCKCLVSLLENSSSSYTYSAVNND